MKTVHELYEITRTQSRQKMHTGEINSYRTIFIYTNSRDTTVYSMTMLKLY